jgi:hypothetical protein
MGRLSDTVMNAVLDELFGGVAYSTPSILYVGLSTTQPGSDGSNVTEPTGNGYTRCAYANDTTNWPSAANRTKTNATVIAFPTPTGDWGSIGYFVIYDAATGGNFYGWGELPAPVVVTSGHPPSFPINALVIFGNNG